MQSMKQAKTSSSAIAVLLATTV